LTEIEIALQRLAALKGQVTSEIITDLIQEAKTRRGEMIDLYNRYKADDATVPVFLRSFEDTTKINNKINIALDAECVDNKVGYMFGKPIVYMVDRTEYMDENGEWKNKAGYDRLQKVVDDFNARNAIKDLDIEAGKMAAICGLGARLCYIDKQGKERLMNVPPWECLWIYDRSIHEPQYAMRYYQVQTKSGTTWNERTRVEWYDDRSVTFYIGDDTGGYIIDESEGIWDETGDEWIVVNPKPHLFDHIPLVAFPNNEEQQGDSEKALAIVDAIDRTMSDVNSEMDQLRLAYMKFIGTTVDEQTVAMAQKTGAFGLPENCDVEFIEKNINDVFIENHLNRLEDYFCRVARHVNFGDEAFAGNQSGVALKFKMFGMESKCITTELKFKKALAQQWRVLCSAWQRKGIVFNAAAPEESYLNIFADFSRNFPLNILEEAQATALLKGMVSEATRLTMLSFVDDPAYEITMMKKEQEEVAAFEREMMGEVPEGIGQITTSTPDASPGVDKQARVKQV
jgi:SPP1 family phage portal protein